jgi:aminoglycoside phosphotransferase (APT) family kinase protein
MRTTVGSGLEERFGPLVLRHDKPFSAMWQACGGEALLKVYRLIEPLERRNREAQALTVARGWGVPTPAVRASGEGDGFCWLLVDAVRGTAAPVTSRKDVCAFVQRTLWLTGILAGHPALGGPGDGWLPVRNGDMTNSGALLKQLSTRCRSASWWPALREALAALDDEECVHLHGDIKPEHFLASGRMISVVDWEAAARGPAVCDHADAVFHVVRDLVYAHITPLPVDVIGRLPVTGPVAAWRLLRWLDRRRSDDLSLISYEELRDLMSAAEPTDVVRHLARLVTALRNAGVPC